MLITVVSKEGALPPTKPPTPAAALLALTVPVLKLVLMVPPSFSPTKPPILLALADEVVPPTNPTLETLAVAVILPNSPTEVRPEGLTVKPVML